MHSRDAPASVHYSYEHIVRPRRSDRVLGAEDSDIKPVDFFLFDVTGGVFEYQITESLGPNTTHSKARPCNYEREKRVVKDLDLFV